MDVVSLGAVWLTIVAFIVGCSGGTTDRRDDRSVEREGALEVWSAQRPEFSGEVPVYESRREPEDTLIMRRTLGDTLSFGRISSINVVGRYLVITDRMMDPHLVVIDRETGSVTKRFGRHGEGPGEFRDPNWVFVVSHYPPQFWVYDFRNRRFSLFELEAPDTARILEEFSFRIGASLFSPLWIGGRIISNGLFINNTLVLLDRNGELLENIEGNPPFKGVPSAMARRLLNRNFLASHPARGRIALVYQFEPQIDFYTAAGARYGTVQGPRETIPRYHLEEAGFRWDPANEMAYWSTDGSYRYVYALFCGCRMEEDRGPTRLHVFDWHGDFIGEAALDEPVIAFGISPDDSLLFGAITTPHPLVGEWELASWLRERSPQSPLENGK